MAEFTYDAAPRPRTPALDGLITAILGGTGEQGRGLARRFAMAGHPVIIGSRSRNRARATAQEVGHGICGLANRDAIRESNLVIVAVPYQGHGELLAGLAAELAGKIVVDCVNPLAAFHHVSAVLLLDPEAETLDQDVLVLGDDRAATGLVQALAARIPGVRGVYGGRLRSCRQVESLTANLVSVNRRYKARAGLRITDS